MLTESEAPLGATNAVEHNEPAHPSSRERTCAQCETLCGGQLQTEPAKPSKPIIAGVHVPFIGQS
jgi:hypothetical protein